MFPALVGMNRLIMPQVHGNRDVPRTRGDEPPQDAAVVFARTMFPALVGMNRVLVLPSLAFTHVPRTRGDEPAAYPAFF